MSIELMDGFSASEKRSLLSDKEGLDRLDLVGGQYVREVCDRTSILNNVIAPMDVLEEELVPVMTEGEGMSDAVAAFRDKVGRGLIDTGLVDGERYAVNLNADPSEPYERTEAELIAKNYDLSKLLRDTVIKETVKKKDRKFLDFCEMAVADTGRSVVAGKESSLSSIFRHATKRRADGTVHPPHIILLSEAAFVVLGDQLGVWGNMDIKWGVSELWLGGIKYMRSIKSELFDKFIDDELYETTMWIFSTSEDLGHNLRYGRHCLQANWERDVLQFQGWERYGLGLSDIDAISKVKIQGLWC